MPAPPSISIPLIADLEAHQTFVNVALAANSSEETARSACSAFRSEALRRTIHNSAVITCLVCRRLSRRAMPRGHEQFGAVG
jgi:hypothetical protein